MPEAYAVVLFRSTSHAIRAERVLQEAGLRSKMIPVPRQISSECGVCIRLERLDLSDAQRALIEAGMHVEGIHDI